MSPEKNIPKTDEVNAPPLTSEKKAQKFKKRRRWFVKKFSDDKSTLDESTSPLSTSKKKTPNSLKPKGKNMKKSSNEKLKLGESSSALSPSKKKTPNSLKPKGNNMRKSLNEKLKLGESSSALSPSKNKTLTSPNPNGETVNKSSKEKPVPSNSKEIQNPQNVLKKPNKKFKPVNNNNNNHKAEVVKKGSHHGKEKETESSSKNHSRTSDKKKLGGFIFMCNAKTKGDCYQYRVMGIQDHKKDLVMGIKPGMKLFLFDINLKLLYGIYKATSGGGMSLEPAAFRGGYPLQVRFEVHKDCLPLPESGFQKAIKENYDYKTRKFKNELTFDQVKRLINLFKPAPVLRSNPQPVIHEPKPIAASSSLLLTEQDYRSYGLRGDIHNNLAHVAPPAYDPYRPDLEREGARRETVFISRPEQETVQLVKPTLTSPPVLLTEQEYRSYGLRGDIHNNLAHVAPPAYDPYRPSLEREGTRTETVFISRPEQETVQLVKLALTSQPVLLTEQEYRSYGLRADRPPVYDPYKPDSEQDGPHPDTVYLNRPFEQESSQSMQLLNPTLTSPPVLLTEQGYRSYGLRGDRPPPAYDPYKPDQERQYSRAPRDALFLSEKDYRTYGLKNRQENQNHTSFTSNVETTNHNPAIVFHQSVPYNPYDQDSDLVERYLPHHVAPPSSSYRFDHETVLSERLYPGNTSNEPSIYNPNVGPRVEETEYKSAPVSSRYAFAGPSVIHR